MTIDVDKILWYYLNIGGDVTLMTKDDTQNNRKSFTLRLNSELSQKVEKEADSLGLTQNSYITMILHKALRKEIERR